MRWFANCLPLLMQRKYRYAVHKLILAAEIVNFTISIVPRESRLWSVKVVAVKILYMVVLSYIFLFYEHPKSI